MNDNERETAEYLAGQVLIYKAAFALLVTRVMLPLSVEAQRLFRGKVEKKIKEILPQALAPHIPAGQFGEGIQDALNEILSELLTT